MQQVHISIETDRITRPKVEPIVAAAQRQLVEHICPSWQIADVPQLVMVAPGLAPTAGIWRARFLDHSDEVGDLGYHIDDTGTPEMRIFVDDVLRYGADLGVTFTHEMGETTVDPTTQREVTAPDGSILIVEIGDPVEADQDGYFIDGVRVSNFTTPAYWDVRGIGPYDWRRLLVRPLSLLPGGYQMFWKDGAWGQTNARHADLTQSWRSQRRGRSTHHALVSQL